MDVFYFAIVGLRLALERAAPDILDFALDEALFPLTQAQADEMAVGEPDLKVVATNGDDIRRRDNFVIGK